MFEKFKGWITKDEAPYHVAVALTVSCAGFALGMPGEIGGILTVLSIGFMVFRKVLKDD